MSSNDPPHKFKESPLPFKNIMKMSPENAQFPTPPPSPDIPTQPTICFEMTMSTAWKPKSSRSVLPALCKEDCGEDAYFFADHESHFTFGIGDGVGGWCFLGVDASLFAWDLMNCCLESANTLTVPDPQNILIEAYQNVLGAKRVLAGKIYMYILITLFSYIIGIFFNSLTIFFFLDFKFFSLLLGSSTACIVTLDKSSGALSSSNLGDSGFIIIRKKEVIYQTREKQHFFNAPYQLSILPEKMKNDATSIMDSPEDAIVDQTYVQAGDVVVLATDGLFDNMFLDEIVDIVSEHLGDELESISNNMEWENSSDLEERVKITANALMSQAHIFSLDGKRMSPFAKSAREHGRHYLGGYVFFLTT